MRGASWTRSRVAAGPRRTPVGGRGLWIANQLCELVQVRTFLTGSVVRLHVRRLTRSARRDGLALAP